MSAERYLEAALDADFGDALAGGCDLRDELDQAAMRCDWGVVQRLMALGIPAGAIGPMTGAGDIGRARVSLNSRPGKPDLFEPEGPDARLLIAVREQGVLVDIAALHTGAPDEWALRRGEGWCLGYDAWLSCETGRAHQLRLHANPLAWLQAGAVGLCVLDWEAALPMLRGLGEAVTLRCDSGHAVTLRARLARGGLPMVGEDRAESRSMSLAEKIGRAA